MTIFYHIGDGYYGDGDIGDDDDDDGDDDDGCLMVARCLSFSSQIHSSRSPEISATAACAVPRGGLKIKLSGPRWQESKNVQNARFLFRGVRVWGDGVDAR